MRVQIMAPYWSFDAEEVVLAAAVWPSASERIAGDPEWSTDHGEIRPSERNPLWATWRPRPEDGEAKASVTVRSTRGSSAGDTITLSARLEEPVAAPVIGAPGEGGGGLNGDEPTVVRLKPTDVPDTSDQALWALIRASCEQRRFENYNNFVNAVICGDQDAAISLLGNTDAEFPVLDWERFKSRRSLPFPDSDSYRLLKATTEAFLLATVAIQPDWGALGAEFEKELDLRRRSGLRALANDYFDDGMLPYLHAIYDKLDAGLPGGTVVTPTSRVLVDEVCRLSNAVRDEKFLRPPLLELIWSYWHEEGQLVQTMAAISMRFQNRRRPGRTDPLANLEIDPIRPLNNLLWGYIQDEQHRLTVARRAFEYDHHYGITLLGKAVPHVRGADSRSRFLEAFHNLLSRSAAYYKEVDDTTVVADAFPVLNALREVHLLLSEGQHNQYGDLPWTARQEMLMQQWILARQEFRDFLPSRLMVVYPEPWMERVDAMKRMQGWTDITVRHFRDLAVYGEMIVLSIRFGNWSTVTDRDQAANWARFWREQVQWYVHAYRAVTGVDLSSEIQDVREARRSGSAERYAQPSTHLRRRLAEQRRTGRAPVPEPSPEAVQG